ncbi:DUF3489 domain-containing protein [Microbaculum marinum]|uniref:DUF3489 domain-containing protein n=1 Tax=Microbaculum marinum TaxID=1764581 RepID=A0AAW9RTE4_9HYPH
MTKLSDTQLVVLSAAARRDDRIALPLPANLKGGAAAKVVASLIAKGLIEEIEARRAGLDPDLGDPIWCETDGHATTLVITDAGLEALGIVPDHTPETDASQGATGGHTGATATPADHDATAAESAPTAPAGATTRPPREGTKQAALIAMLRTPEGATIAQIVDATGWQPHTVRGAIAGALKKKLGLNVTSDKVEGRGRVYRIV